MEWSRQQLLGLRRHTNRRAHVARPPLQAGSAITSCVKLRGEPIKPSEKFSGEPVGTPVNGHPAMRRRLGPSRPGRTPVPSATARAGTSPLRTPTCSWAASCRPPSPTSSGRTRTSRWMRPRPGGGVPCGPVHDRSVIGEPIKQPAILSGGRSSDGLNARALRTALPWMFPRPICAAQGVL